MPHFRYLLITILLSTACGRAPSSTEAATILRSAQPAVDSGNVTIRVWADGPPWFSCAEVLAKLGTNADSAVIRRPLTNWRALVIAHWVTLRDTTKGPVTDPGWCRATLHDAPTHLASGWTAVNGDSTPTGDRRVGWDVAAGTRQLVVRSGAKRIGADSAVVDYLLTVVPNPNGSALGADQDTTRRRALLLRTDGEWRAAQLDWPGALRDTAQGDRRQ
ncbi:MAG: hypothetical protein M3Z05_02450 [Gemmatimonadota bacterium]|nr:hypothetical protein [Gemmatimonadota bacterium]